jgi:flagellar biosynthesis/type III secretory pathway protein FliH
MTIDLVVALEECAVSYEQSGPSAHHTAALLREAAAEIADLKARIEKLESEVSASMCEQVAQIIKSYMPDDNPSLRYILQEILHDVDDALSR